MLISATEDVPDEALSALADDLRGLGTVQVDENRTFLRSAEPPSWIVLLEQTSSWVMILGPSAAVFLSELLKEAAKDTWRNKERIARALANPIVQPLRTMAAAIARFRGLVAPRTEVDIGIPLPDDYFGTRLRLEGTDADSIALEIALYIQHCGAIEKLFEDVERGSSGVLGHISLRLLPDGSMQAEWMSRDLEPHNRVFPPPAS
jgi:hypothetical protein